MGRKRGGESGEEERRGIWGEREKGDGTRE